MVNGDDFEIERVNLWLIVMISKNIGGNFWLYNSDDFEK